MPLFRKSRSDEANADERPPDMVVEEELSELSAQESRRKVDQAVTEAAQAVSVANIADIREMHVVKKGRCPKCGARIEELLFTSICAECGWYRREAQFSGEIVVYLDDGEQITCDRYYRVEKDQLFCVQDSVVTCCVSLSAVKRIDYKWNRRQLERARETHQRLRDGVCCWCEADLSACEGPAAPYDEYVAFGAAQEHHVFCSLKCLGAFRKQYPVRIHRNCYETDCNRCNQCIKRFDTQDYVRVRLEGEG